MSIGSNIGQWFSNGWNAMSGKATAALKWGKNNATLEAFSRASGAPVLWGTMGYARRAATSLAKAGWNYRNPVMRGAYLGSASAFAQRAGVGIYGFASGAGYNGWRRAAVAGGRLGALGAGAWGINSLRNR